MKTTLIVVGETVTPSTLKPITFHRVLTIDGDVVDSSGNPHQFKFVELISRGYSDKFDVMFAYDTPELRRCGTVFLGKWNDGVLAPAGVYVK